MIFDVAIYVDGPDDCPSALVKTLVGASVTWEQYGQYPETAIARDVNTGEIMATLKTWDDCPFEIEENAIRFKSGHLPTPINGCEYGYWVLSAAQPTTTEVYEK